MPRISEVCLRAPPVASSTRQDVGLFQIVQGDQAADGQVGGRRFAPLPWSTNGRQVPQGDRVAFADDAGPLDDVLQLPHVARPVVGLQGRRASSSISEPRLPLYSSGQQRLRKWSTSRGMSSTRSRRAGRFMGITFRR